MKKIIKTSNVDLQASAISKGILDAVGKIILYFIIGGIVGYILLSVLANWDWVLNLDTGIIILLCWSVVITFVVWWIGSHSKR